MIQFSFTAGGGEYGNRIPTPEIPYIRRAIAGYLSHAGKLYSKKCEFLGPCCQFHNSTVEKDYEIQLLDFTSNEQTR